VIGRPGLMMDVMKCLFSSCVPRDAQIVILIEPGEPEWAEAGDLDARVVLMREEGPEAADVLEAVLRGADAVIGCDATPNEMRTIVAEVAAGGTVLTPPQTRALSELLRSGGHQHPETVQLTAREKDILRCIEEGMSVKQTALALGIARKTVENLRGRLFRKLGARNRAHALMNASELRVLVDARS
jgi:DNA-binding NarL/FixJ family response regulator